MSPKINNAEHQQMSINSELQNVSLDTLLAIIILEPFKSIINTFPRPTPLYFYPPFTFNV